MPRPPGAGRKKGTPNKVTRTIREAAAKHGPKALRHLVELMDSPDLRIRLAASREILDRAYGRPVTPAELTGKDGEPLHLDARARNMSNLERAQRLAFILASGVKARDELAAQSENVVPLRKDTDAA